MDKKSRIVNSILLSIMGICFFPIVIYLLVYIYSKLNLSIFEGWTIKSYIGDIFLFFGMPIFLIVLGIYKYFLYKYYKLIEKDNLNEEKEDIE